MGIGAAGDCGGAKDSILRTVQLQYTG